MNIFRLIGDMLHLFAILILLQKIWISKSCKGVSGKSQFLYALVFTARYTDLFLGHYISVYNTSMKIFFLAATYTTVFLIYYKFRETYDHAHDTLDIMLLMLPVAALALFVNYKFTFTEVLWTFSIYLEALAILPQLFMINKTGETEIFTFYYLLALGSYRAFYLLNWVYRYQTEGHFDAISIGAGIIQTLLYCDFFILAITKSESLGLQEKGYDVVTV